MFGADIICISDNILDAPFDSQHCVYTSWKACINRFRNGSDEEINCNSRKRLIRKCGLDSLAAIKADLEYYLKKIFC